MRKHGKISYQYIVHSLLTNYSDEVVIMPFAQEQLDEIKRKLRKLKKLEIKIRFSGSFHAANIGWDAGRDSSYKVEGSHIGDGSYRRDGSTKPAAMNLIWDEFFHIGQRDHVKSRYTFDEVASMSKEEYRKIVDEFFFRVYYKYYIENGITGSHLYDPEILEWMGLQPDAGSEDIKKKFREMAKKYHPDTGGDANKFIELLENYRKLIE